MRGNILTLHWRSLLLVFALWLAAVGYYGRTQKPVSQNNGQGWDGMRYAHLFQQIREGTRLQEEKPYVYRIGTPFLAAKLGTADPRLAFHIVNLVSILITGWLLYLIMVAVKVRAGPALFLTATFFLQWHAPLRQQLYDSFGVDSASQPFTCLILLAGLTAQNRKRSLILLSILTFVGVFFRESVLFAALAVWLAEALETRRRDGTLNLRLLRNRDLWLSALPIFAGLAGISITHLIAHGEGPYGYANTVFYYLYHKPPAVLLHAFFNGYGTVLIPVLVFHRVAWKYLQAFPILGMYALIAFLLGWTAGGDTTRVNYWGCFALLPIIGLVLSDLKLRTFGVGIFLALQFVSMRVFFPMPDYPNDFHWQIPILTNWGTHFPMFDLWSELANPRVLMISLFQYLLLTAAAFLYFRWVGREKYLRIPGPHLYTLPPK